MTEVFKPIPGWPEYEVSNFGRVKSLPRLVSNRSGKRLLPGVVKKLWLRKDGYKTVGLSRNQKQKVFKVCHLVSMAFLDHTPDGYKFHIDHINRDRSDDRLENLRVISARENTKNGPILGTSKYTGVGFHKGSSRWRSRILIDKNRVHLGNFIHPYWAHLAYQQKLRNLQT